MGNHNKVLGKSGEDKAKSFLESAGYTIMAVNYSCRIGEIDIIAMKDNTLVFVEVKTRTSSLFGTPGEAVDFRKQIKCRNVALSYIQRYGHTDKDIRFDIIEVYADKNKSFTINHIINAFQPGAYI